MTLGGGVTDKKETISHSIVKFLIYKYLLSMNRKCSIEYNSLNGDIFDAVDWSNGIVYEPLQPFSKKSMADKLRRYILVAGIKDVVFIDLTKFKEENTVKDWKNRIKLMIA